MSALPDELRLSAAILLNVTVFVSALALSRRLVRDDPIQSLLDAFLLTYLVQYVAVGLPGMLGILNFGTIAIVAILISGLMWFSRERLGNHTIARFSAGEWWVLSAGALFVIGEVAAAVYGQRFIPPLANDALTYHLPAAVSWLQSGRLRLYETWFYNPANTYSPLAGSIFMAWLISPVGNDALARFAQAPALLFLFFGMVQLCRQIGATIPLATFVAVGAVLSRPFVSQSILAKDDLFVAVLFVATVAALTKMTRERHFSAWRLGIALGLLLSTKYTVLLSVPLLILMSDLPLRARWPLRDWLTVLFVGMLLAGPWYVRNWCLTGNPLFPIRLASLPGLFTTARSSELMSFSGIWRTLVTGYSSTTMPLAGALVISWLAAVSVGWRKVFFEPLLRVCLIGTPVGILIFIWISPYPEIRFVYPSLLLLFVAAAFVAARWPWGIVLGVMIALAGIGTGFIRQNLERVLPLAVLTSISALAIWWCLRRLLRDLPRLLLITCAASSFLLGCLIFIYWSAYLRSANGYASICVPAWRDGGYGELADAWDFIRQQSDDEPVAYANTFFVYPLHGFDLRRPVVYIPTRAGVNKISDLPDLGAGLSGEELGPAVLAALFDQPDRQKWLEGLGRSRARYLFIMKENSPPELQFTYDDAGHFVKRFENSVAVIFEIVRD